jgi:hypothetical protein
MATNNAINSGGPVGLTLIQTQIVSSVTEVDFTVGITPSYNNYLLFGSNINLPAAMAGDIIQVQLSTDGGISYDTTNYTSGFSTFTNGMDYAYTLDSTTFVMCNYNISNLTSGSGYIISGAVQTTFETSGFTANFNNFYDGYNLPNTVVNALRLVAFNGSAFSGTISLYGYIL